MNTKYAEYLNSGNWIKTRNNKLKQMPNCEVCGEKALIVHHLTYERIGNENVLDLVSLCKVCHEECHIEDFSQIENDPFILKNRLEYVKNIYGSNNIFSNNNKIKEDIRNKIIHLYNIGNIFRLISIIDKCIDKYIDKTSNLTDIYIKDENITYDNIDIIFFLTIRCLCYERNGMIEESIKFYEKILNLEISDSEIGCENIWVYFAKGLALTRVKSFRGNGYISFGDLYKVIYKGFKIKSKLNNLIIKKYGFIIKNSLVCFEGLDFIEFEDDNGLDNYGIIKDGEELLIVFYKYN